ncbi:MAG: chalcone isomerase family protein, partial [Candidatus Latescibacteria bacterium]|nr:chalcone isomerase family protein [Candidatus Latescibacterota bacterium]
FRDKINKNDVYDLIYIPGKGTEVHKNEKFYSLTEGLPFKQALFGIWLCENPAQKSLKKEMLGK